MAAWVGVLSPLVAAAFRWPGYWTRAACGQICGGMTQPEAIVQTARVTVHGHRITYREADDPRDPVLLVHGFTSSSADSDPVIPAFTERTHLLAPDLLNLLQKPSTIDFKIHKY
jgi:hypothetical protein